MHWSYESQRNKRQCPEAQMKLSSEAGFMYSLNDFAYWTIQRAWNGYGITCEAWVWQQGYNPNSNQYSFSWTNQTYRHWLPFRKRRNYIENTENWICFNQTTTADLLKRILRKLQHDYLLSRLVVQNFKPLAWGRVLRVLKST